MRTGGLSTPVRFMMSAATEFARGTRPPAVGVKAWLRPKVMVWGATVFARGTRPSAVGVKAWLRPVVMVSGTTGPDQAAWLPAGAGSEVAE
ncbi:hypothetical protein NBRGN_030_00050 [Nocardia brasiliensis NBRC 14402]|nr:hypothetical protein NBRGN_030_00050 [Nocardia brasiliensis NBRC 14402]